VCGGGKIKSMPSPLKLANAWRIIRDVDLEAIRRHALLRFELWIVAEDEAGGAALGDLLGGAPAPHPWLRVVQPAALASAVTDPPLAAILLSPSSDPSPAMTAAREALRRVGACIVTVVAGTTAASASVPHPGEDARVAVEALDAAAADAVGAAVVALFADDRRLALARQLPPLRQHVFQALIQETAQANASFALTTGLAQTVPVLTAPLNLGDIVVLTKNQLLLGYRIVLAAGRTGDPRSLIGEIIAVLGSGLLFRQAARQLVGLIPVVGLVPKVAIAYSGTWAVGKALVLWVTEGRAVTAESVQSLSAEGLARGREFAERIVQDARRRGGSVGSRWQRWRGYLPRRR
jgi:uncharacterized protein (DUF697 family)